MPGLRRSEGRFLQILEPGAAVNLPIEFDVYGGGNPATMIATLDAAFDGAYQEEMSEVGAGSLSLLRSDPKAVSPITDKGNYIRVKTGGKYRGGFWVEEPTERLTSAREASGEILTLKGRGALAYLERGSVYPPVWPAQPVSFRSASHANNTSAATIVSCAKPPGMASGDCMIAAVAFAGGSAKILTPPPGWRAVQREDEGTALGVALFQKTAGASEAATYKWAFTTATKASVSIVALANASSDFTEWGYASTSAGSGTAIKHPSLSVGTVDGSLLTVAASTAGTGITQPGSYTEATEDVYASSSVVLETAYRLGPVLGDTGDATSTDTNSGTWIGMHLFLPSTATNDASFAGETPGAILSTLIDRAKARGAIPVLTYDFTAVADSVGNPWADTFDLTFHAGTSLLDVWRNLVALGMQGRMDHSLNLQAFVDLSRDRTADVILRKGYHFLGDVENTGHYAGLRTRYLVEGAGGRLLEVTNPALEADPRIGRREGFLSMGTSDSPTDLQRAGEVALALSVLEDESRTIPVDHGLLTEGRYEPWEDYRGGDYIGLDADGTGAVTSERVVGITVAQRDALDYTVELGLNSVSLEASVRMKRQLDALARTSSSGGYSSSGLSLGGGASPGGGAGASGKVQVQAEDAAGYLLDKVDAASPLTKALGGVPGNRSLSLGILRSALGTGTPDGTKFLRDDGAWAAPPGGGSSGPVLDRDALHPTYGDDFSGASLNPRWTRRVVTPGEETYQVDGGKGMLVAFSTGAAARAYYQAASFTNGTIILSCHRYAGGDMTGPFIVDASGNGIAASPYNDNNFYLWSVSGWAYAGTGPSLGGAGPSFLYAGYPYWISLRKAGTTWFARISLNGMDWSPEITTTSSFTMASIGWGRIYNTPNPHNHYVNRFNVLNVS